MYILEELCDVLAAALGPRPGVCVMVESGSHDMILVLHAGLPTFGVIVMRHVESVRKRHRKSRGLGTLK